MTAMVLAGQLRGDSSGDVVRLRRSEYEHEQHVIARLAQRAMNK